MFFEDAVDLMPAEEQVAKPTAVTTVVDDLEWVDVKAGVKLTVIRGNHKEGAFVGVFDFPAGMTTNAHTAAYSGALVSGSHQRGATTDALTTLTEGSVWLEPAGSPRIEKGGEASHCLFAATMDGALDTQPIALTTAVTTA